MGKVYIEVKDNFSTSSFRKYIDEFEKNLKIKKNILLDLQNAKYVSVYGVMLIEVYQDIFKENNLKFEYKYRDDSLISSIISLVKKNNEKEFEKYFKDDYLKISRCFNSKDTHNAANTISSILKNKMKSTEEVSVSASWLIAEVADNAGVHGYKCLAGEGFPKPVYIVACENGGNVDICIVDRGCGIVESLKKHGKKHLKGLKEKSFIVKALEKGVSGHPVWSPGFGLYGTSEIVKKCNGCMEIFSNGYTLHLKNGKISPGALISDFGGTFIALRISKNSKMDLQEIILDSSQEQIVEWRDALG